MISTDNILFLAGCTLLLGVVLVLIRAILGPTVYDRILAANAIGTRTVILVSLLAFLNGRPGFLDIAMLYALINFVVTIALLKFKEYGRLG
jgi:multicomponent Na+:H+ antiporter subunit F